MRFSRRELVGGAMLITALIAGCDDGRVVVSKEQPCQVLDTKGHEVRPISYPLGSVEVEFQEARTAFNEVEHNKGQVIEASGRYALKLSSLPEKLTNGYIPDFYGSDAVVIISHPELGRVGLTPNCIVRENNEFNIPSIKVELPTYGGVYP